MKTKSPAILILIGLLVACNLNREYSESQQLEVVFSKTFENASIDKVEYSENGQALLVASAYDSIHILDRQNFKALYGFRTANPGGGWPTFG